MSKSISVALKAHMAQAVTTLATCWKITRVDGTVMGFTDATEDLVVSGVTYKAATGFTPSAVKTPSDASVPNIDVYGMLNSSAITNADLAAGKYDYAAILIFIVNYADLTMGTMILRGGWLGQCDRYRNAFKTEVRGKAQALQQVIGDIYSPTCTATLGDTRCKQVLTTFTKTGSVTAFSSASVFTDSASAQADSYFNNGVLTWTSGLNNGLRMEIKSFVSKVFTLPLAMPYAIGIGDTYSAVAGCDKTLATCVSKFNNVVNFRGFPNIPGIDQLLRHPDAK